MLEAFILNVLASVGVSAALSATLLWLTKPWISEPLKNSIKHEYDQKLETHKAQLKAQSDVEIEQLKSRLNIAATEHQITFTNLHERRAEVIAEMYSLLKILVSKLYDYIKIYEMSNDLPKEERRQLAIEAFQKFGDYHQSKIIFVPVETARKLNKIQTELVSAFNEFMFRVERGNDEGMADRWIKLVERLGSEIRVALGDLENDFRRLLGETRGRGSKGSRITTVDGREINREEADQTDFP